MNIDQMSPEDARALVATSMEEARTRKRDLERELRDVRRARLLEGAVDDEHDPEGETTSSMWSMLQGRLMDTEQDIEALNAAAQRIEDGTYGICATCSQPISQIRLRRRPAATQCIDCARRSRPAR